MHIFRPFYFSHLRKKSGSIRRVPIALRLALGFLLVALLAAIVTEIIGSQHATLLSQQSNFYQALLRIDTTLTNGTKLLKSIDKGMTTLLENAAVTHPNKNVLANDELKLHSLMTRYTDTLSTYASQDLLPHHPDQLSLLSGSDPQTLIEQQCTYTDGALHTWQVYQNIQNHILQEVKQGNGNLARDLARLQGEPAITDALSALQSLIQFNEHLGTLINENANHETEQQLLSSFLGSLGVFLGVLLIGFFLSRTLVRPLKQLHHVTQAVEQGQIDARVRIMGRDEIADVSQSVNKMLDSLVEAIKHTTAAKEQIDRAYQQQYQLNMLKDHFIQNVSHELRTPLTEIFGFLQLLYEHQDQLDAAKQAIFLQHALNGCEELLSLFTTILDAADIDTVPKSLHIENVPLSPIIEHILEQYTSQEKEEHPIHLDVPVSLTVQADEQYLTQILLNLLSNAFKYTPPKTPISLHAEHHKVTDETSPDHILICVRDAGPGIPSEEQGLLFQQFVRLKRDLSGNIRGTGLGLYLCRQFVTAMNGHIWVESTGIAGEGSSFYFTLPTACT